MAGDRPFRFISFNVPNLHYVEDALSFDGENPWRLPDEFEIADALGAIAELGGQVVRTYALSVRTAGDGPEIPRHILGPGQFHEAAFQTLDKVLELAKRRGLRVIVPLVDNWRWWGGINEYAAFRSKQSLPGVSEDRNAFWTDRELREDFKRTIDYVLHRRNIYTGTTYADDPTILAWEPVNEPREPYAWTREIAAHLKSQDPNHLVLDGYHSRGRSPALRESLDDPNVDIVSTHHYPTPFRRLAAGIRENAKLARGKKPYLLGEFGFARLSEMREVLDTVVTEGLTGALAWSLRSHAREGGFYWHSEGAGPGTKAYHWPGFASGDAYEETALLSLVRSKAYEIQGLAPPPLSPPPAPALLEIRDVGAISWQGSVGARSYRVERSTSADGPWLTVARDVSDAGVQYRPLFNDRTAPVGGSVYYRVVATNDSGDSPASNVVGPVLVEWLTLVDELSGTQQLAATSADVALRTDDARRTKEDAHRLRMPLGSWATYRVPGKVLHFRFDFFFPTEQGSAQLAVSTDGETFHDVSANVSRFASGESSYGFLVPTRFEGELEGVEARSIRVRLAAAGELGRAEIRYLPDPTPTR